MIVRVVECEDHDVNYGILKVKDKSEEEIQSKIYEIKKEFEKKNISDWTVEDVFKEFPKDWHWLYYGADAVVEI